MKHAKQKIAFGDFQTPLQLAEKCCDAVQRVFPDPDYILEPTCGQGSFVIAAARRFKQSRVLGFEINDAYRRDARKALRTDKDFASRTQIKKQDFFQTDWQQKRERLDGHVLFIGNPPWVTNSQLGVLDSKNLPAKSNVDGWRGIDAMTGRSNFDISESILVTLLDCMRPDEDFLAVLVKTATARKVLRHCWKSGSVFSHASIRRIDAKADFGVNVDACLLMVAPTSSKRNRKSICYVSDSIARPAKSIGFGWFGGQLVADPGLAAKTEFLVSDEPTPWRSGVKHDLSRVVELCEIDGQIQKQDGTAIRIERQALYPLAKGADVANNRTDCPTRRLLVTQRSLADDSDQMAVDFPLAYRYLEKHRAEFAARKSSIYRNRDPFALFGVGPYTFQPWKIAICGLYKKLQFSKFGPIGGKPVVTDDTCYTLSFDSESEAEFVKYLLESKLATDFFQARIFWDAKRPITADVLRKLDLRKLACARNLESEFDARFSGSIVTA